MVRCWMLALTLAACGGDDGGPPTEEGCEGTPYRPWVETVSFTELPALRPAVQTPLLPDVSLAMTFGVQFIMGKPVPLHTDGHAYCPVLEDEFTATLGGTAGTVSRGGWTCAGPSGMVCATPRVEFDNASRTADAQIVLTDSKQTLTLPLGDALVPRTMERLDQPDWTLQVGQPVSIRWTPGTDLADLRVNVGYQLPNAGWAIDAAAITITDDTINFTVPDDDRMGPGRLTVSVEGIRTLPTHTIQLSPRVDQGATYVP